MEDGVKFRKRHEENSITLKSGLRSAYIQLDGEGLRGYWAEALKEKRKREGYSQKDIAEMFELGGSNTVCNYEKGFRGLPVDIITWIVCEDIIG